jgi:hypothetical protein
MPFVFPSECDAVEKLAAAWPTTTGKSFKFNPVAHADAREMDDLERELRAEGSSGFGGMSEQQRKAATKVYDSLERLLENEGKRTSRIHREDWDKNVLLASGAHPRSNRVSGNHVAIAFADEVDASSLLVPNTPSGVSGSRRRQT